ncbi:MAG TPA: nickel-type superoxide dismutase maturation protease [Acidimicrobiales bacterium]|nr:nickel-type superoxide dismutase maturation protease [Acidimicrobiales bacterium]
MAAGYPRPLVTIAAATVLALGVRCGVRRVVRVEVQGHSMAPTLWPGDRMVAVRGLQARQGDIVAARDPRTPSRMLIKRVAAIDADRRLHLAGDDPSASTDSRTFGPVAGSDLVGRVVWRYWPGDRRGPLPRADPPGGRRQAFR